jgi:hypothetical protein
MRGGEISGVLLCERSATKALDGFVTLRGGTVAPHAAITREDSRPLNGGEVRRVLAANLCIVCHQEAKDPIYRKELDYGALDDPVHRPLLDPQR